MSTLKSVPELDDFENFELWKTKFLGHEARKNPSVVAYLQRIDAEDADAAGRLPPTMPATPAATATLPSDAAAARTAAAVEDALARAEIISCLSDRLGSQLLHFTSGMDLWRELRGMHDAWQRTMAPVYEDRYRIFQPVDGENMMEACGRFDHLLRQLISCKRPAAPESALQHFLKQLAFARPGWEGYLQAVRATVPEGVAALSSGNVMSASGMLRRLAALENSNEVLRPVAYNAAGAAHGLAPHANAAAAGAAPGQAPHVNAGAAPGLAPRANAGAASGPAPRAPAEDNLDLRALTAQMNKIESMLSKSSQSKSSGAVKAVQCHRCLEWGHIAKNCPALYPAKKPPPGGQSPARPGAAIPSNGFEFPWLLDSGTTHHMSSGAGAGAAAFRNYQPFATAQLVHFGKRGASAPALGMGDLVVPGVSGWETLRNVLHVPEIAVSLFSVRDAVVNSRMSVSFWPSPDGPRVQLCRDGGVVFTASERGGLFYLDGPAFTAAAAAAQGVPEQAMYWHRQLGHLGLSTLADLARSGLIQGCPVTAAEFLQAQKHFVCEPCALTKMRRASHPSRSVRAVRVLGRVHADLCQLEPGRYLSTFIDEATRYAHVGILSRKSDTATFLQHTIAWAETQTGAKLQRMRHDNGGEYLNKHMLDYYRERGVQVEPTPPHTPEANGVAERHNLTLLDIALPMLEDSGDPAFGLAPLGARFAPDAFVYANDLHNAKPAASAVTGRTPLEGFLGRSVELGSFRRFGGRVWVFRTGHRSKLANRAVPGRFLGFERPLGCGIYRVLLDGGHVEVTQRVIFGDAPAGGIVRAPPVPSPVPVGGGDDDSDSEDDDAASQAAPQAAPPAAPQASPQAAPPAASHMQSANLPKRSTRAKKPQYNFSQQRPRAQAVRFAAPLETVLGPRPRPGKLTSAEIGEPNGEATAPQSGERSTRASRRRAQRRRADQRRRLQLERTQIQSHVPRGAMWLVRVRVGRGVVTCVRTWSRWRVSVQPA